MGMADLVGIAPFLRKLESRQAFTPEERQVLGELPHRIRHVKSNTEIGAKGARPTHVCVVLDGFAACSMLVADGGRQIVSLHIPGDMVDLHNLLLPAADHNICALSPMRVAFIPHLELLRVTEQHPGINRALWRDMLVDAAIYRRWLLNIGRRDADARIAHLLCEIVCRLEAVGCDSRDGIFFPLSQPALADATGLTAVHVNRTLQRLRKDGLIALEKRHLHIHDWERLEQVAGFEPDYLHGAELGAFASKHRPRSYDIEARTSAGGYRKRG